MGTASDSGLLRRLQTTSKRFDRDPTDNAVIEAFVEERPICFGVVGASSGMVTLPHYALIPDRHKREVV